MLWIIIILLVFIFQIATILVVEFRHPSKTVAWLFILFMFPAIGFIMYYFLAKEYGHRRKVRRKGGKEAREVWSKILSRVEIVSDAEELGDGELRDKMRLFELLENIANSPVTKRNHTTVLTNGDQTYNAIAEAINAATDHIHMEYYTIRSDKTGEFFRDLLIAKARQGVKVRIVYDGVGSYTTENAFIQQLRDAGIEVGCFLPPWIAFFDKRVNYRNHRKIVVVDGKVGFLGGINIGNEYLGGNKKLGFWRDTHLRIEGDAVFFLQLTFLRDWAFVCNERLTDTDRYFPVHDCCGTEQTQIIASGPDSNWDSILELFFAAITTAKQRILITTPYFVPDPSIEMALKAAAVSGVEVQIIFPGKPDSRIVNWASLSYVEELLEAGVRFFQYQKGFIHSKVLIIDQSFATVGTANMDMRSFFSNFELNAVLFDRATIHRLEEDFLHDLEGSDEIMLADFERRSRMQRTKEAFARLLSPLL